METCRHDQQCGWYSHLSTWPSDYCHWMGLSNIATHMWWAVITGPSWSVFWGPVKCILGPLWGTSEGPHRTYAVWRPRSWLPPSSARQGPVLPAALMGYLLQSMVLITEVHSPLGSPTRLKSPDGYTSPINVVPRRTKVEWTGLFGVSDCGDLYYYCDMPLSQDF